MADLIGQQLGQYTILEVLGHGGMATVYRAQQLNIDRQVAIKVIKSDLLTASDSSVGLLQRFEREARMIAQLSHPNILKLFDYGHRDDLIYLVTELISGGSLDKQLQGNALPLATVEKIVEQIGAALNYAHQQGIIHRDLKPQNVLIDSQGNAILADFGIAQLLDDTTLSQTNSRMGTPSYMAPEQWRGESVGPQTDVYALGVMLFQLLTRKLPFQADTAQAMMYQHLHATPPSLHLLKADLPAQADKVLQKALAKNPADRYETPLALVTALKKVTPTDRDFPAPADPIRAAAIEAVDLNAPTALESYLTAPLTAVPAKRQVPTRLSGRTGIMLIELLALLASVAGIISLAPLWFSGDSVGVTLGALGIGLMLSTGLPVIAFWLMRQRKKRDNAFRAILIVQFILLPLVIGGSPGALVSYTAALYGRIEQAAIAGQESQTIALLRVFIRLDRSKAAAEADSFNQNAVDDIANHNLAGARLYLNAIAALDADPQIDIGRSGKEKAVTQYNLGLLHEADSDPNAALDAYRLALKQDDTNLEARYALSSLLLVTTTSNTASDKKALSEAISVARSGWETYIPEIYCRGPQKLDDPAVFESTWYCFILQTTEAGTRLNRQDAAQGDDPAQIQSLALHAINLAEANGQFRKQGYFTAEAYYYLALATAPNTDSKTLCAILSNYDLNRPRHRVWAEYASQQLAGKTCTNP